MGALDITKLFKSKSWDLLIAEESELARAIKTQSITSKPITLKPKITPQNHYMSDTTYWLQKQEELIKKISEGMEKITKRIEKRTERIDYCNEVVENSEKIYLDLKGIGTIKEILVIADKPDFRVSVISDYEKIIDDDFNTLSDYSTYVKLFDAFTDGTKYIFSTSDISFLKNLKFSLIAHGKVTFYRVYSSYDIRYEWEGL